MRLLLIEDDRHLAEAVARGLRADGFAVDHASESAEGAWMAQENVYDTIVMDVMLPGLNGFALCQSFRARGDWTPILMLTAKDGVLDEAEALDSGADDFLSKPFAYVVLLARVRALVRRGGAERPAVLRAGDLYLDPATHRAGRGNTEIALSPRQFSLLEFLMRRAGDPVSKADILAHVWDFSFDGDPNIVEVYVLQLRRKVDSPFGRRSIETLRYVGYRLDADGG
jgi:two-component system OmpR family response regulator